MNKARLLKLARHLETGSLGHRKFNFEYVHVVDPGKTKIKVGRDLKVTVKPCNAAGCALGELPFAFPGEWKYPEPRLEMDGDKIVAHVIEELPQLIGGSDGYFHLNVQTFFEIDSNQMRHLFYPGDQIPSEYGGMDLGSNATRKQVAANIRAFVRKMSK